MMQILKKGAIHILCIYALSLFLASCQKEKIEITETRTFVGTQWKLNEYAASGSTVYKKADPSQLGEVINLNFLNQSQIEIESNDGADPSVIDKGLINYKISNDTLTWIYGQTQYWKSNKVNFLITTFRADLLELKHAGIIRIENNGSTVTLAENGLRFRFIPRK